MWSGPPACSCSDPNVDGPDDRPREWPELKSGAEHTAFPAGEREVGDETTEAVVGVVARGQDGDRRRCVRGSDRDGDRCSQDLVRRPASEVRGSKFLWAIGCFVQPIGSPLYLVVGRR